jgi:hypothetical protein
MLQEHLTEATEQLHSMEGRLAEQQAQQVMLIL